MNARIGRRRARWLVASIALASGCETPEPTPPAPRPGGDIVAVVDGVGITTTDVADVARERGLSARDALDAIEDETLLARAAERRGIRIDEAILRKRILAQLLLRRLELAHGAESIDAARIDALRPEARRQIEAESEVVPAPPPDEAEVTRRATETAIVSARHEAVARTLQSAQRSTRVEVVDVVVATVFARDDLFEGIR